RHTFPRAGYDERRRKVRDGPALAAAGGVDSLMRRTYKNLTEPAPAGEYDFINYFECADADVPVFHEVCGALRDVARNPEWKFVHEGRSEEHTSELQSLTNLVCRLLLEKKKN